MFALCSQVPAVPVQMCLRLLFSYFEDSMYTSPLKEACIWAMDNRNVLRSSTLKVTDGKVVLLCSLQMSSC